MCVCVGVGVGVCVYVSVHDQMRLNYIDKNFEYCISLNRGDVKPSYGERIKFLSFLQPKLYLVYFFTLVIF